MPTDVIPGMFWLGRSVWRSQSVWKHSFEPEAFVPPFPCPVEFVEDLADDLDVVDDDLDLAGWPALIAGILA